MLTLTRTLLTSLVLLVASATAQTKPPGVYSFEFYMGMPFDEVKALKGFEITDIDSVGYRRSIILKLADTPPEKSALDLFSGLFSEEPKEADFTLFRLYFTPDHGLFKLWAWSDEMDVGNGGENIMPKYQAIKKQLAERYSSGGYRMQRSFNTNAWDSPEDWTRRFLNYDGQAFISEWKDMRGLGGKPFPDNVTEVKLLIVVETLGKGRISLTTEFTNTSPAYNAIWEKGR